MNEQNKHTQSLITPEDIPGGVASRQGIHAVPEMIEMPESLQPTKVETGLADAALGTSPQSSEGRSGIPPVTVENPGPQSYTQAAANGSLPDHLTILK